MEPHHLKASIQVVAASVIYGFAGIFFVYIKSMAAGPVVFYQLLFGFLALIAYMAASGKFSGMRLRGKRKALFLFGAWQAGVMVSYYTAVSLTNVSVSVLLLYTAPLYVVLLAPLILKEKLNRRSLAALVFSLAGVAVVVGPEKLAFGPGTGNGSYLLGVLMGLFAGLLYACIILTSRYLRDEYSGLEQLFFSTGVTLVLLLPYTGQASAAALLENLPVLLFLGVMITSLGSILYFTGLMHVKAQNASIISLLEPVSAIFFAYILLNDPISGGTLLGCTLILASSFLVSLDEEDKAGSEVMPGERENERGLKHPQGELPPGDERIPPEEIIPPEETCGKSLRMAAEKVVER
ncbi:DMT family transporter [Methanosarcina sp. KYL-1]|uniref:DMT family transporter n=1 Tax=Methanosarcina sp. KYL-1 TaxID=2602068 RepID=UPI002100BF26|nr:DMT family transporter [Methanosarcina sp. KYL-1]MCQ1536434.1 DMT family transporter [Methanosarcina sp. KYL-1]